jgi:hypothetical protein
MRGVGAKEAQQEGEGEDKEGVPSS